MTVQLSAGSFTPSHPGANRVTETSRWDPCGFQARLRELANTQKRVLRGVGKTNFLRACFNFPAVSSWVIFTPIFSRPPRSSRASSRFRRRLARATTFRLYLESLLIVV